MHDLLALIGRIQVRARLARSLAGAARGLLAGSIVALAWLALDRAAVPGLALTGAQALAVVGLATAAFGLAALRHGLARRDAALAADRVIGTREALAAALETGDVLVPTSPFAALVRDKGERLARGIDAAAVVPLGLSPRARRELALGLVFAIAIATGFLAVPRRVPAEAPSSDETRELAATALTPGQVRDLADVASQLDAEGRAEGNWRKLAAADDIAKALHGLEAGTIDDTAAAREWARLAGEMADEQRSELARQRAWRELEHHAATRDLAERIARGENDIASARAHAEAALRASEEHRRELARALEAAARQAAGSSALEHALERAAHAVRSGQAESLAEALADAGREMQAGAQGISEGRGHERLDSIGKARSTLTEASRSLGGPGETDPAKPLDSDGALARAERDPDTTVGTDGATPPSGGQQSDGRDRTPRAADRSPQDGRAGEPGTDGRDGTGEQAGGQQGDGQQGDGQQAGGQKGDGQQGDGQQGDGQQAGGQKAGGQQGDGQQGDGQQAGGQKGDGQQAGGQKGDGQQAGGQQGDGPQAGGQQAGGQQGDGQQAGGQQGDGQKAGGQKGDGQQAGGQQAGGQQAGGQQGDGQKAGGQKGDGQQAGGQQGDGQQAGGQQGDGRSTEGPRSDGVASDGHTGGVDRSGSDRTGTRPPTDHPPRDGSGSDRAPPDGSGSDTASRKTGDGPGDDPRSANPSDPDHRGRPLAIGPDTVYDPDTASSTFDTLRPHADRGDGPISPQPGDARGLPSRATSGVDPARVLPRYLKAVERAQRRQYLPAEFRQRVGRYFDDLGRTPLPAAGSGSGR